MADLSGFDAARVEPQEDFEAIPADKYEALITNSEMKATKAGDGSFLELAFEIIEGQYKGRKVWARLNLDNKNPVAEKIAQRQLSAVCRAIGVLTPRDSSELHNLPLLITVRIKTDQNGEARNEIRAFAKLDKAPPATVAAPASTSPPTTPPWKR